MATLRTPQTEQAYKEHRNQKPADAGCALCDKESLKSFKHWKIIENAFPYDKIAAVHHMVVPLRHATEAELSADEYAELDELKDGVLNDDYEYIIEATHKTKSIPGHFHLHLIVAKE